MKSPWRFVIPLAFALALPLQSLAQVSVNVSVNVPPPELPVYEQPPIPEDGYIWTPGYWAWGDDIQDYYWVPGTWVQAPEPEYLWTPGYWGADGAVFFWHPGYWGPHVGFYGGVNYGYGYGGNGYDGGYWQGGHMYYNRSVNNVSNVNITNVYNRTVINNATNRVSYNGGNGIHAQPNAAQMAAERDRHIAATSSQQQHAEAAHSNPSLRVSQNHGRPPIAATSHAAAFTGAGVVAAGGVAGIAAAHNRGTMSVVHPDTSQVRPPPAPTPRPQASAEERNAMRDQQQRDRPVPPQPQPRPAAPPQPHPPVPAPRPAEHPPERGKTMSTIEHDVARHRFVTHLDGYDAVLDYTLANKVMVITHTGVPKAIGGRGVAAELMKNALAAATEHGWTVHPACSYAAAYMRRHSEDEAKQHTDELLDEALDESYPASDSPSVGGSR